MMQHLPTTPYFLIDETKLLRNLQRIQEVKVHSGVKMVLALKCFSTWGVFPIIAPYLEGTTSSGPLEVRLGYETFGGETHGYSVAYSVQDVLDINPYADKVIFNSLSQYTQLAPYVDAAIALGLRINPGVSYSGHDLANPARQYSRLGVHIQQLPEQLPERITGLMFHMNCDNADFSAYSALLDYISAYLATHLAHVDWVSLGGGVAFTHDDYPRIAFANRLKAFMQQHNVHVYLEPGEAVVTHTTDLVVSVLDIVENEKKIAIVDSATEAHRLDCLIYNVDVPVREADAQGAYEYIIGSCSCLAGDVFTTKRFAKPLQIGDRLHLEDAGGYTMVKTNWFNGLKMPSVFCKRTDGDWVLLNESGYADFKQHLSRWSI